MGDDHANGVHMGREEQLLALALLVGDQVAHGISTHLIHIGRDQIGDHAAHAVFTAGRAKGGSQFFQQFDQFHINTPLPPPQ